MYKNLAQRISNKFIAMGIVDETKKDIYVYGFEYIISNFVYLSIFFAICFLSKTLLASLCFWLGIFILRKIAGGHHANSYISCHILFAFNHILFIAFTFIFPPKYYYVFTVIALLIAFLSIYICAPVDHKNKPFIKTEYKRYKTLSYIYGTCLLVFDIALFINLFPVNIHLFGFAFGTLSATISLLCAKYIRNKERSSENEKIKNLI